MKTTQDLVTRHLDIWTAADTEKKTGRGRASGNAGSVYGIKKLRELILELAVRGKLVPQDANDEPASELIKRIQMEKARLITDGKIKKQIPPSPPLLKGGITAASLIAPHFEKGGLGGIFVGEQQPDELPQGWEWTTLASISLLNPRNSEEDNLPASFVPMTMIGSRFNSAHDKEARLWKEIKQGFTHFAEGDIGVAKITPCFENSKACVFSGLLSGIGAGTTELHIVRPINATLAPRYILAYLKSPQFLLVGESKMTGTAGQKRLPKEFVESNPFPLPPLAEQHRIVAKVDELMALCDQLESQHNNAAEAHEKLVSHLLGSLTQSQKTDTPLSKRGAGGDLDWQRIVAHFDTLFTTEASIDTLKQTLLQLAVMGKLVPQDPNDEPASAMLKRIQAEKTKLFAEGKIKKDKPLPLITEDEKPFELPKGWEWIKLGEVLRKIGAGSTPLGGKQVYLNEGIPFLRSQNVWDEGLKLDDVAFISLETHLKMSGTHVCAGDLLFNITGASIGRCAIVPSSFETGNVSQHVTIVRAASKEILQFLHLVLISKHVQQTVMDVQVGVSREGLSIGKLGQFIIPMPPLAEQHRIVAKVDELISLCDLLKTRITQANQLQQKLADVVVEQAIA
jgi:type I restriction enzyme S subunit